MASGSGAKHFQPSSLAVTSIDTGNPASNVIPAAARAVFNIRFNDLQTSESVKSRIDGMVAEEIAKTGCRAELAWSVSGESFLTQPGPLVDVAVRAIEDRTRRRPALTTGGGTSDARFIKDLCPVVEIGLVSDTMHQVDERTRTDDIRMLSTLYLDILRRFFDA